MEVYKFGGASVRSAEGIRNIVSIVSRVNEPLFMVVSAMGKTTNAMEEVLEHFMKANRQTAFAKLAVVEAYHAGIVLELFGDSPEGMQAMKPLFDEIKAAITNGVGDDYDRWYDRLVSYGELFSTKVVSAYLQKSGVENRWLDMRGLLQIAPSSTTVLYTK